MGITKDELEEKGRSADERADSMHSARSSVENPVDELSEMAESDEYEGVGFRPSEVRTYIQEKLKEAAADQGGGSWSSDEAYIIGKASEEFEVTDQLPDDDVEDYIESELISSDEITTAVVEGTTYFVREEDYS